MHAYPDVEFARTRNLWHHKPLNRKMLTAADVKLTKKRNYHQIRELIRISFGLGVNLTTPTRFKDALRLINIFLLLASAASMYGHWSEVMRYINNIPKMAESICTALQTVISMIKLFYFLFTQRAFQQLLYQAQTHTILQRAEILNKDFPVNAKLKLETARIMDRTWKDMRYQLIFYICACTGIISNYFFYALFKNLYHQLMETPNYHYILPFPTYYPVWAERGMSFPYYHIQMFLSGCADYIAGMGAVSFDGLFIVLCLHSVGLIEVLKVMVGYSTSDLVPKQRRVEYLRYCIFQHRRIFEYVNEIERMYKHISLSQFLLSLLVLGIVLFNISVGLENDKNTVVRMLMYISAAGYEVIIYCYNGQRLATATEGIPGAFYNCEWYNESKEFKQMLQMMILRSNRTLYFKISWFTTMALPTLVSLMRTSGSYFLLLRNLSE